MFVDDSPDEPLDDYFFSRRSEGRPSMALTFSVHDLAHSRFGMCGLNRPAAHRQGFMPCQ